MGFLRSFKKILRPIRSSLRKWRADKTLTDSRVADSGEGFLYVVFGESFSKEARFSIESLRRHNSEPIMVLTDHAELFTDLCERIEVRSIQPTHKRAKVDFIQESGFRKTIYLDSDTLVVAPLSDLFGLLDRFDVIATIDAARKRQNIASKIKAYDQIPYAFSEVNGGVIGFNSSEASLEMLRLWRNYFYRYFEDTSGWDQPSLRIALWDSSVRLCILPAEYNIRPIRLSEKTKENRERFGINHMQPRIFHSHYSDKIHQGEMTVTTLDQLEQIIREQSLEIKF